MLQKGCLKYLRWKPKDQKHLFQTSTANYCFLSFLHTDAEQHHGSSDTTSWSATGDSCYHGWHSLKSPIWFNQDKEKKVFLTWQALTHNASAAVFFFFYVFFLPPTCYSSCQLISAFTTFSHPVLLFLLPLGDGVSGLMYEVFSIYSTSHMISLWCVLEKGIYPSPRWSLDSLSQIYKKQFDLIFETFFTGTQLLLTIYLICMSLQPTTVFQYWFICYNFSVRCLWLDGKRFLKTLTY